MSFTDTLRKLGIFRSGSVSGTYKNAVDRPTELQMDGVYNADKDLVKKSPGSAKNKSTKNTDKNSGDKTNTLSIVGFVLSFFVPLAGIICSVIGLNQIKKRAEKGKGLAIAGIIISIVVGLFQLLVLAAIISGPSLTLTTYKDSSAGYSVQYPKDWKVSYQEVDGAKGVLFKDEYKNTGKVTGQVEAVYIKAPKDGYSKDVLKAIADSLKKDNQNTQVVYESTDTKDGLKTLTLITTYDGENGKIKSKTTVILKKDNSVLTISTQSPEQNWEDYQDTFDEIHSTVQP